MTASSFFSFVRGLNFSGSSIILILRCLSYFSARVDLSGCWTDTPPITYEHGGAVLTVAINFDGKVTVAMCLFS